MYSPRYTRHVANELFETLTQFYREILKPEFDRLCTGMDGMATKSDMREFSTRSMRVSIVWSGS